MLVAIALFPSQSGVTSIASKTMKQSDVGKLWFFPTFNARRAKERGGI
jgi:hypothetical protein